MCVCRSLTFYLSPDNLKQNEDKEAIWKICQDTPEKNRIFNNIKMLISDNRSEIAVQQIRKKLLTGFVEHGY